MSSPPVSAARRKQILKVIFVSLLLDLISFTFILPLFPKLLEFYRNIEASSGSSSSAPSPSVLNTILSYLNAYKRSFARSINDRYDVVLLGGALGSLFSLLQAIASPFIGRLSDIHGRRKALLWSMAGNIISVALWVAATDFRTFLSSRIVGGLSEGNVQLATAMAADVSDETQRGATMAMVGVCFSIAFTFGPALGAALARVETVASNPFATAAAFSLFLIVLETIYLYLYLPETRPSPVAIAEDTPAKAPISTRISREQEAGLLKSNDRTLGPNKVNTSNSPLLLNITHLLFLLIFSGMEFSFPFLTYDLFTYTPSRTGSLLGYIGLTASVIQGTLTRRSPPLTVVRIGIGAATLALFSLSSARLNHVGLWAAATLLAVTSATVVTGLSSLSSLEAGKGEMGGRLGMHRSFGQAGRALGPVTFCTLYWWMGREVAYMVGGVGMLGVGAMVSMGLKEGGKSGRLKSS